MSRILPKETIDTLSAGQGKLRPKLIVEGARLTGKTDLVLSLADDERLTGFRRYRYPLPVISAEWSGLTKNAWGRSLVNYDADEESAAIKAYEAWLCLFETLKYLPWIIDRFYLSTIVVQQELGRPTPQLGFIDERLRHLGFRTVLLTRSTTSFESARQRRLTTSGNPSQYDDMERLIKRQSMFLEAIRNTTLPYMIIDVSDNDLARARNMIYRWLLEDGGLYNPD